MDTPDFTIPDDDRVNDAPGENPPKSKKTRRSRYDPEPDWSAMVRAKVTKTQHRVGQACDRCKLKKMKCTPDPGGCACCLILNIPCKVTDRVTGETWVRGEAGRMRAIIESLKKQTEDLKEQVTQLQQKNAQLQDCLDGSYRANLMDHYEQDLDPGHHHHSLL
ncbi:hypothetical protein N7489_006472 [Penicillium chrysogenum]|uniref:Zn(2)-C6 fungal-type domain-containing protein n=1 Tax=Penicillium chrysogenum TaxID=5076 RepID=A0ABQ8W519_PENCH|nr:uncharacterized protein N7489_006472 [Penicillium chrysogenum]KAJ5236381.1 hypothetical protein N7489_006472 [Penicillium chrysogenum]KAJ5255286.1 hypothetical protein N7505_010437 [Penicillium chrysogenum]KAJ5276319.1 hypothetical protein N7524_002472 [Penicillium chrysogenum]KAJ6152914.1 hypothetical protein N7497_007233 [Penicillium chrysogenum]